MSDTLTLDISPKDLDQLANSLNDIFLSIMITTAPPGSAFLTNKHSDLADQQNYNALTESILFTSPSNNSILTFTASCDNASQALLATTNKRSENNQKLANKSKTSTTDVGTQPDIDANIDLVAEYIGSKYDNEKKIKARLASRGKPKTAGSAWFDLPATEVTQEVRNHFAVLQHRGQLTDSGHFLRVEKSKSIPKYFQMGTIIDNDPNSYENLSKKQKKRTLTDEFFEEARQKESVKKKFKALNDSKVATQQRIEQNKRKQKGKQNHVSRR